jgi:hypothetical protein
MKIQNQPYLFPVLILLVFLITYSVTFDSKLAPLGDNASYYMLGQALAQGEGFVNISKIDKTPNNHYPPGYPAILSVFMHFTESIVFFKLLNGLFLALGMILLYMVLFRLLQHRLLSFLIVAFCLLNYHLLQYSSMMMSEVPFFFFTMVAIWSYLNYDDTIPWYRSKHLLLCLVAILIAYHVRSLGIGLLGGVLVAAFIRRKWGLSIGMGVAFVVFALPWFIRSQRLGGGSYIKQMTLINPYQPALGKASVADFITRIQSNFSRYITEEIPNALFPFTEVDYAQAPDTGEWLGGLLLFGLIIYGLFKLPSFRWLFILYLLFTFVILMIWPDVWVGVRFIVPLIPILALGFFHAIFLILQLIFKAVNKPAPVWALGILLLILLPSVNTLRKLSAEPLNPAWANYYGMAEWLRRNESSEVVVSCGKPTLFYLYSQTYTVRYAFEQDPALLIEDLENEKVDYVVIDQVYPNTIRYLLPALRAYPERFEQVYHLANPDTFLLRFKR